MERTIPLDFPSPALSARSSSSIHKPLPPTPLNTSKRRASSTHSRTRDEIIELYLHRDNERAKLHLVDPYTLFSEASRSLQSLHAPVTSSRGNDVQYAARDPAVRLNASDSALILPQSPVSPLPHFDARLDQDLIIPEVSPLTPSPPPLSPWPLNATTQNVSKEEDQAEAFASTYRDTLLPDPFLASQTTSLAYHSDAVPLSGPRSPKQGSRFDFTGDLSSTKPRSGSHTTISTVSSDIPNSKAAQLRALALRAEQRTSPRSGPLVNPSPFKPPPVNQRQPEYNETVPFSPTATYNKSNPSLDSPSPQRAKSSRLVKEGLKALEKSFAGLNSPSSSTHSILPSTSFVGNPPLAAKSADRPSYRKDLPSVPTTLYQAMDTSIHESSRSDEKPRKKNRFSLKAQIKRLSEVPQSARTPRSARLQKSPKKSPKENKRSQAQRNLETDEDELTRRRVKDRLYGTSAKVDDSDGGLALEDTETYETSERAAKAASQLYTALAFNRSQTWPVSESDRSGSEISVKGHRSTGETNTKNYAYNSTTNASSSITTAMKPSGLAVSSTASEPNDFHLPSRVVTAPVKSDSSAKLKKTAASSLRGFHSRNASAATSGSRTSASSSLLGTGKANKLAWLRRQHGKKNDEAESWREEMKKKIKLKKVNQTSVFGLEGHMYRASLDGQANEGLTTSVSLESERPRSLGNITEPEWVTTMRLGLTSGEWDYDLEEEQSHHMQQRDTRIVETKRMPLTGDVLVSGPTLGPYAYSGVESAEMDRVGGSWL